MNYDDDNVWKKLYRRWWWFGQFVLIPLIVYGVIDWLTKSFVLAISLALFSFVVWTIIFFVKGLYKEIL
jgi:hypothetical protein